MEGEPQTTSPAVNVWKWFPSAANRLDWDVCSIQQSAPLKPSATRLCSQYHGLGGAAGAVCAGGSLWPSHPAAASSKVPPDSIPLPSQEPFAPHHAGRDRS